MSCTGPLCTSSFERKFVIEPLGTLAGLLPRIKLGIDQQAVFEVIDAEPSRFLETDRAQVPGDFRSPLVRGGDGRREFLRSDEHVSLEIVDAFIEPEIYRLGRVIRSRELVHLQSPAAGAFEVRSGNVNFRAQHLAFVDGLLDFEVGVRLERSGGADRGNAACQIKPRKAVAHLAEDAAAHGIEQVIVHADQAGNHAVTMKVQNLRILGRSGIRDRDDLSLREDDGLIGPRRSAGPVNHPDVGERDNGRIDLDERFHCGRKGLTECETRSDEQA